jgi:predicted O-methyltransferase YrrM
VTWLEVADEAAGWLDFEEGNALARHAARVANLGPLAEIGGYAGKSACWLGAIAQANDSILFSIDWHRGSPEMAVGESCHDPQMIGPDGFDTLPHFRRNIATAGLEPWVVPVVGNSAKVGQWWNTELAFLFIDGAHDSQGIRADYELWSPRIVPGGVLAFHDTTIPGIASVVDEAVVDGFEHVEQVGCLQVLSKGTT